mgnify:FL=1
MTLQQRLENITWYSLTGAQAHAATGSGSARRYAPGFSPIAAFADPERADLAALAPYSTPGEHLYCGGWSGPAPAGWQMARDSWT